MHREAQALAAGSPGQGRQMVLRECLKLADHGRHTLVKLQRIPSVHDEDLSLRIPLNKYLLSV